MKSRILITLVAMLFYVNIAWAQGTDVVLPAWAVKAAADINNTNPATVEQFADPLDNFKNSKNEFTPYNSTASVGASTLISKYISIYNIPLSYSFKTKLLFKGKDDAYENLAIKLILPMVHKMFEVPGPPTTKIQTTGLGDVSLKLNYSAKLQKTFFTFGILSKLPTAKKSNLVNGHDVPLGTNSTDIDLSAFCSKDFSSKITGYGSLGYDIRTKMTLSGVTYDYGSRFFAMIGGEYFMNGFSVGADFSYSSVANDKISSSTFPTYPSPGITALDAMPYVRVNLPYSLTASLTTYVPIVSKYKSVPYPLIDADRKIKVGISLVYKFSTAN